LADLRGRGGERDVWPSRALSAKASADERCNDTHVVLGKAELVGEHMLCAGDILGRIVNGQALFILRPVRYRGVELDGVVVEGGRAVDVVHLVGCRGEGGVGVALRDRCRLAEDVGRLDGFPLLCLERCLGL
jgi:hypothetical protein